MNKKQEDIKIKVIEKINEKNENKERQIFYFTMYLEDTEAKQFNKELKRLINIYNKSE